MSTQDQVTKDEEVGSAQPEAPVSASPAPEAATEATPTETSGESAEPKTILEAALSALKPGAVEDPAAAAQPAGDSGANTTPTQTPDTGVDQGEPLDDVPMLPDADFKALPPPVRKTFVELRKLVKTLRPDAERGTALSRYLAESGVSPEEFVQLQDAGALIKRDPMAARKILLDKVAEIDRVTGLTLPDDLQQEVESGYVSEDRARELSQLRARAARAEETVAQDRQVAQQHALLRDVTSWEAEMRRVDADFARKLPDIQSRVRLAVLERERTGQPVATGAEAVKIAQDAYDGINQMIASFAPPRVSTRPTPSSAASAPATSPQPRTLIEAAMAGLNRRAG
jgi:hypothetical protein